MVDGHGRREIEADRGDVEVAVEIEAADLPLHRTVRSRSNADFLRELIEIDRILRVARKRDEARTGDEVAPVNIAAAAAFAVGPAGDAGEGREIGFVIDLGTRDLGLVGGFVTPAGVVEHRVAVVIVVQLVVARAEDIGAEQRRLAVEVADRVAAEDREAIAGSDQQLRAAGDFAVGAVGVFLAGETVVDPIVALLPQARKAQRHHPGCERQRHAAIGRDAVEAAIADRTVDREFVTRLDCVDLDDAGRRVAAEQRALRAAQHFDALDVEDREGFERDVFHHHVVHHHRDRLRGGEVEIGIAEPADIEARCGAAVRAFDEQARHARGQRGDFGTGIEDRAHGAGIESRSRNRDILQVFLAPVGGDDNRVELARAGFCGAGAVGVDILREGGLRSERREGERAGTEKTGSGGSNGHVGKSCLSAHMGGGHLEGSGTIAVHIR